MTETYEPRFRYLACAVPSPSNLGKFNGGVTRNHKCHIKRIGFVWVCKHWHEDPVAASECAQEAMKKTDGLLSKMRRLDSADFVESK